LGKIREERGEYATDTASLEAFALWLKSQSCRAVALESTGVYWQPVFNVLETEQIQVCLVNARHVKNVPGRKTDLKDSQWLAQLFMQGLLRPSLIPEAPIRVARSLIRRRKKLIEARAAEVNRLAKALETANIKLSSVVSDLQGLSAMAMLKALVRGERDPEKLAALADPHVKATPAELAKALKGRIEEHHVLLLKQGLEHHLFLTKQIEELSQALDKQLAKVPGADEAVKLLDSIPGVEKKTAEGIFVEMGGNLEAFPSAEHMASWAGMCPGNHQSAGKQKSGKARHGNQWLRKILVEAAWAAARKKGSYLNKFYHRLAGRLGKKRAVFALAHKILMIAYQVLKTRQPYVELGETYYLSLDEERRKKRCIADLRALGYEAALRKVA
jgi:transposase